MDIYSTEWREKGVLLISKLLNKNGITAAKILDNPYFFRKHLKALCTDIVSGITPASYIPRERCYDLGQQKADSEKLIRRIEKFFKKKNVSLEEVCNHYLSVEKHFALLAQSISKKKKKKKSLTAP